jgi:hypothetical protein
MLLKPCLDIVLVHVTKQYAGVRKQFCSDMRKKEQVSHFLFGLPLSAP